MSDARLIVWDPMTSEELDAVDLTVRPVVSDSDLVTLAIERDYADDVLIPAEWVGKKISIQVSAKAVTSDRLTSEIVDLARRMGAAVG